MKKILIISLAILSIQTVRSVGVVNGTVKKQSYAIEEPLHLIVDKVEEPNLEKNSLKRPKGNRDSKKKSLSTDVNLISDADD